VILTAKERGEAIALASHAAVTSGILTLRAGGQALRVEDTDAMLARAVARERVELELDLLAYEQGRRDEDGNRLHNRNHVRFRDGAMIRLGRTGRGAPFLRDHRQNDSHARSGTVIDSRTEKVDDEGHYQIIQTVRLTEPSAVERALRGLMSAVSIGWRPTGPVHCTSCKAEVFTDCYHFPGDTDDDGRTVEWEFQDAELLETSEVPVPGVPTAGIDSIRASLAAAQSSGYAPQETSMKAIATVLGLAAAASEDEVTGAVTALLAERDAARSQLDSVNAALANARSQLAAINAERARVEEDAFIAEAIQAGKVQLGAHEAHIRAFFRVNPTGTREMLASAPSVTPVGAPAQAKQASPSLALVPPGNATVRAALEQNSISYDKARSYARMWGAKDPDAALAALAQGED